VVLDTHLTFSLHISKAVLQAAQSTYALEVPKSSGLPLASLTLLCRSTLVRRLLYASTCMWGCWKAADRNRLLSVLNRAVGWVLCSPHSFDISSLCNLSDNTFFRSLLSNPFHTLHLLLPPPGLHTHNLCSRSYPLTIPQRDSFRQLNFIRRMLFI